MHAFCAPLAVPRARVNGGALCARWSPAPRLPRGATPPLSARRAGGSAPTSAARGSSRSRKGTNASQNSRRVPTYKKLQRRERKGPAYERESARAATDAQRDTPSPAEQPHSDDKPPVQRQKREITLNFSDIFVGEKLHGVVRNTVPHGAYVNVGAEKDGLVHLRNMSVDFVHMPSDLVREGDSVTVWVKYVDPARKILGLTMVKPHLGFESRIKVAEVEVGGRYRGVVERVTNYGAYIDIGAERQAFLHVTAMWGERQRDTLDYLRLGQTIWVHVAEIDLRKSHVRLWARAENGGRLTDTNPVSQVYLGPEVVDVQPREAPRPTRRSWQPETLEQEEDHSDQDDSEEEEQVQSAVLDQVEDAFNDEEFSFAEELSDWTEENRGPSENKIRGLEEIAHLFTDDTEFVTEEDS